MSLGNLEDLLINTCDDICDDICISINNGIDNDIDSGISNWGIYVDVDGMYQVNSVKIYPPGIDICMTSISRVYKNLPDIYYALWKLMEEDSYRSITWPQEVRMIDYNDEYLIDIRKIKSLIPEYFV